jgi:hypothetical protein
MGIKAFGMDICPLELFTGDNGKLATTKIWTNIAYGFMTYKIYQLTPPTISWEYVALFTLYGAIVGSSYIAAKFLDMKFSGVQPDTTINQPVGPINVAGDIKIKRKK